MTPVSTDNIIHTIDTALKEMAVLIHETLTTATARQSQPVVRLQVPVKATEILSWLQSQHIVPQIYWSGRDDEFETAAVGIADEQTSVERVVENLQTYKSDEIRYYGGFRFDSNTTSDNDWICFGKSRFILPRFELSRQGEEYIFACNLIPEHDSRQLDTIMGELEGLSSAVLSDTTSLPPIVNRADLPDIHGWDNMLNSALAMITDSLIDKIVLARESSLVFTEPFPPLVLMQKLKAHTRGCYHFCFSPANNVTFLGAPPEQLYIRNGNHIKSEALAGTRQRGDNNNIDSRLGDELLTSDKDIREHRFVIDGIKGSFRQLCREYRGGEQVELVKLTRVQHLVSYLTGELRTGKTDSDILHALHPTPAVCGLPSTGAQKQIAHLEPFDRGWYAGPMGWLSHTKAEFAVAIRSGLFNGTTLKLYSGAGIVAGSDPILEWEEIESKIHTYLQLLT